MDILAEELREILKGGNPRKLKTYQKMPYAGENRSQRRRHTCQDEKPRLKKEEKAKGTGGWGYTWKQKPAKGELVCDSAGRKEDHIFHAVGTVSIGRKQ